MFKTNVLNKKRFIFTFQLRYDDELQRIVYEPVELAQEFRKFTYDHPWEMFPKHRETEIPLEAPQVEAGEQAPEQKK